MNITEWIECQHCAVMIDLSHVGVRGWYEVDPAQVENAADLRFLCPVCVGSSYETCQCCHRVLLRERVPFQHTNQWGVGYDYCWDCHDAGCGGPGDCSLQEPGGLRRLSEYRAKASEDPWARGVEVSTCSECSAKHVLNDDGQLPTHDVPGLLRQVCPGSGKPPFQEVTDTELDEVYRSLGFNPNV